MLVAAPPLDPKFVADLLADVAGTLPGTHDPAAAARIAFAGLRPADAEQAMLAAEIIGFHYAAIDNLRRAMLPDTDDGLAMRLRANAAALARMKHVALRALRALQAPPQAEKVGKIAKPAAKPAAPEEPAAPAAFKAAPPRPDIRDAEGNPIPLHRWEDMTMDQRRLAYGYQPEQADHDDDDPPARPQMQ